MSIKGKPINNIIIPFKMVFYVHNSHRNREDFSYNPWRRGDKLIGGVFRLKLKGEPIEQSHWIWEENSEKMVLQKIYRDLKVQLSKLKEESSIILLTGGEDIFLEYQSFFSLLKRYNIVGNQEIFEIQKRCRPYQDSSKENSVDDVSELFEQRKYEEIQELAVKNLT